MCWRTQKYHFLDRGPKWAESTIKCQSLVKQETYLSYAILWTDSYIGMWHVFSACLQYIIGHPLHQLMSALPWCMTKLTTSTNDHILDRPCAEERDMLQSSNELLHDNFIIVYLNSWFVIYFNFWDINMLHVQKSAWLMFYISCHSICAPVDQFNKGQETESYTQSQESTNLDMKVFQSDYWERIIFRF